MAFETAAALGAYGIENQVLELKHDFFRRIRFFFEKIELSVLVQAAEVAG